MTIAASDGHPEPRAAWDLLLDNLLFYFLEKT